MRFLVGDAGVLPAYEKTKSLLYVAFHSKTARHHVEYLVT